MKRIWARVGMSFEVDDEEYENFINDCRGNATQKQNAETTFCNWVQNGIGKLDGESYFPEQECFGDDTTDNVEEISFLI